MLHMFLAFSLCIAFLFTNSCSSKTGGETSEISISESDFHSIPADYRPWVYYWWLKGNVSKELITRDLEEMKNKGIGGILLFDSRGYHDGFHDGNVPVPLEIKHEFMSPGWREMVRHTLEEAHRLGLNVSINLANTGGSLRGPWDMKDQGPKQLIWTQKTVKGPSKLSLPLEIPADKKYFQDITLIATQLVNDEGSTAETTTWQTITAPENDSPVAGKIVDLQDQVSNNLLEWEVPEGTWRILRFGYHVIGEEGSVDILHKKAVTDYFQLMGAEILKDAGDLARSTLTHFYNVSWEGGLPDWTIDFEKEFKNYRGYDLSSFLPVLAGINLDDSLKSQRFLRDYWRTVSDCFKQNCYATIGELCHASGLEWHSENGGPWTRQAPMFREADQLEFWGENDMPQGEFWCSDGSKMIYRSNVRYTAMAAHIYGLPCVAVEGFTEMVRHWTKYPAELKPYADYNFIDGGNFFIWHTFTASPPELGKPGYEYFAGTHFNPNVTWWNQSKGFIDYMGRCQYLLRQGHFTADICCYVSDKNYVTWGRGEKWSQQPTLSPAKGYTYDLINTEVLLERLSVKDGKLVLPDGMSYRIMVVDLEDIRIPVKALDKISQLVKDGATVVLGGNKPAHTPGLSNDPDCDQKLAQLADELWSGQEERKIGKGMVYRGKTVADILNAKGILPDFEGPFEYIHRNGGDQDIYFLSGAGKGNCTFRVSGKKPECWNPLDGSVTDALCYQHTDDGRTTVWIDLPENGSTFVVFREKSNNNHFTAMAEANPVQTYRIKGNTAILTFGKSGHHVFEKSTGEPIVADVEIAGPLSLTGPWKVTFKAETGTTREEAFEKLLRWDEHPDPDIKYFSGTATYSKTFTLDASQAQKPAWLQLGLVHDICQIWINGEDLGVVWTAPWEVDLTGILKEGTNELQIEVTNCWANRLIGDAGLPENKRTTSTNVRLVPDREQYRNGYQAFSAKDPLMPSGLVGPVSIAFGETREIEF